MKAFFLRTSIFLLLEVLWLPYLFNVLKNPFEILIKSDLYMPSIVYPSINQIRRHAPEHTSIFKSRGIVFRHTRVVVLSEVLEILAQILVRPTADLFPTV